MNRKLPAILLALLALAACFAPSGPSSTPFRAEVQRFLDAYSAQYQKLSTAASEARWAAQTRIVPGEDLPQQRVRAAEEALAQLTGATDSIELSRAYLRRSRELVPLQVRQLQRILFLAAGSPQTAPTLVKQRIAAETAQVARLYGFTLELDGAPVTANEIDAILRGETDLERRRRAWEASKQVGAQLRKGLIELRSLRNEVVRALGFTDFDTYMVSEYGMSPDELATELYLVLRDLRPLQAELHTWARHELAARYGQPVPEMIPAHWLPNRWGQDWSELVEVEGLELDAELALRSPRWLVEQGERFYVSLGFEPLPVGFWERSSLLPVPAAAGYSKNNHASAWHVDLDRDVRCLMSLEPNTYWYETVHHELGHVYYDLAYSTPRVPLLLRTGAARAFHEGLGSLLGLAAMQPRFVREIGLGSREIRPDPLRILLKQALNYVVFMPWSAGVMTEWEREIYQGGLPSERWNARWWELVRKYQGIAPPSERDERWCDAATKTHVNDDPAAYYDYALSTVLMFQLHDYIARKILREDAHDTLYWGRRDVGAFLQGMMQPGASMDWRELMRRRIGTTLSARPMVDYFAPLQAWLAEQNRGRAHTLPSL